MGVMCRAAMGSPVVGFPRPACGSPIRGLQAMIPDPHWCDLCEVLESLDMGQPRGCDGKACKPVFETVAATRVA